MASMQHNSTPAVPECPAEILCQATQAGTADIIELTTEMAAEHLGVSRSAVVKMIERGELPAHKVGSHHRVRLSDVHELKHVRRERQREAFAALRDLDEQLDRY